MPISRARVVCALALTIATFCPTSALTKVDLPALGAPMTATKPARVIADAPAGQQQRRFRLPAWVSLRRWGCPAPPPAPRPRILGGGGGPCAVRARTLG